jgi:AcrR family transcriptional regulator
LHIYTPNICQADRQNHWYECSIYDIVCFLFGQAWSVPTVLETLMTKNKLRPQIKREDYLIHALKTLSSVGISAVTIELLSKNLGVTRGSFYHHFKNRQELLDEMLDYWIQHWTIEIRQEAADLKLEPSDTLLVLMRIIRRSDAAGYEIALRNWAQREDSDTMWQLTC